MRKLYASCLAILPAMLPPAVFAGYDGSEPFMCASVEVIECIPHSGCTKVSAESIDAPRFIKVDVKNKKLSTRFATAERSSAIERVETVEGKLMIQGAEEGREGQRDGLGWTMSVTGDQGNMVMTASGEDVAFVIFGACTSL